MVALQHAVDALRRSRIDADHRATRLENELAALRLNERILEDELRTGAVRAAGHEQLRSEHSRLRADHARLREEHARLLDEHVQLRDEHADTVSLLESETRRLRDVEAARAAADAFAAEASHDLGEAVNDLIDARRRNAALEAELTHLRADHDELVKAHDAFAAHASAAQATAERNLAEQRRAHDALRADAAAAHERQLREAEAAHERAIAAAEQRIGEAEAQVSEISAQLQEMTQSRDQAQADLEKSRSEVDVVRQRLRGEIDAHSDAEERRGLLEDELSYLRAEIFASGQTKGHKRGLLGRRGRGTSRAVRQATATPTPSASKDATDSATTMVPESSDDDRESLLERRLYGR
jgi:chromosome segregation ATPase